MGFFKKFKKAESNQQEDLAKEREEVCKPIAKKVLEMSVQYGMPIGKLSETDEKKYQNLALQIIEMMLQNDIKYSDKDFIFQLALQPIDKLRDIITTSLKRSFDTAIEKAFGNKDFMDVTLKDLDNVIKGKSKDIISDKIQKV